jgi:hypothetical protein
MDYEADIISLAKIMIDSKEKYRRTHQYEMYILYKEDCQRIYFNGEQDGKHITTEFYMNNTYVKTPFKIFTTKYKFEHIYHRLAQ